MHLIQHLLTRVLLSDCILDLLGHYADVTDVKLVGHLLWDSGGSMCRLGHLWLVASESMTFDDLVNVDYVGNT